MFRKKKTSIDLVESTGSYIENINNDYAELLIRYKEAIDANQSLMREIQHIRFSTDRDRENSKCSLIASISAHLLNAYDNLTRIYKASASSSNIESIHKGIEMILKEVSKSIQDMNLVSISCIGKPFDPNTQEIGGMLSMDSFGDNIVIEELRTGYEFNGKVIRPSLVIVNKKPHSHSSQKEDKDGNNNDIENDSQ
ncbi:MAG: nucleotide exchange factor GrpE [Caldisericia bacterium]|nr:nucleotide exchange factor GrpE [Caldisericia bacterium]MDD4614896.1 nucleotide exchange factor GrpE [Caldisericia bacterium]